MGGNPTPPRSAFTGVLILQGQGAYLQLPNYPIPVQMMAKASPASPYDAQTAFDYFSNPNNIPNAFNTPTITVTGYSDYKPGTQVPVLYVET
jgi:hypothetical protein